jgi:hypothetical protein
MVAVAVLLCPHMLKHTYGFLSSVKIVQTTRLTERQINRLCDEVANALIDVLNSQNVEDKIKATIDNFLTSHNLSSDASDLLNRVSWSVKVSLKD